MFRFAKFAIALSAFSLLGFTTTDGRKDRQAAESEPALQQTVVEYETVLPVLAGWGDYRSASNVALGLASARNRLEGTTPAVCEALSRSRLYQRLASSIRPAKADYEVLAGIYERTGGMKTERAVCDRAQALPRGAPGASFPAANG